MEVVNKINEISKETFLVQEDLNIAWLFGIPTKKEWLNMFSGTKSITQNSWLRNKDLIK